MSFMVCCRLHPAANKDRISDSQRKKIGDTVSMNYTDYDYGEYVD